MKTLLEFCTDVQSADWEHTAELHGARKIHGPKSNITRLWWR